MSWSWESRIARATDLETKFPESVAALQFYRHIAGWQRTVAHQLTGRVDVSALLPYFPSLLQVVDRQGPKSLVAFAGQHLGSPAAQEGILRDLWQGVPFESELPKFFARAALQPFAESLASRASIDRERTSSTCPFCNARPVVAVLRGEGEGAKRSLLCSLCATEWQFRRVVCPNCGLEDKDQLPVYLADDLDYIRVEACDVCKTYIKSVDLTKDGHAVPLVDEMAALSLALWAEDSGYVKVETNLLGM